MTIEAQATTEQPLLRTLAEKVHGITLASLPGEVVDETKRSIIDNIGCMLAASALPEVGQMLDAERTTAPGEVAMVGVDHTLSVESAARVGGYMLDVLEVYDLVGGHASETVIPTALAVAQTTNATGPQFVESVVAGLEIASRVLHAYYPHVRAYDDVAVGPCGVPNALAAAATASHLMGLTFDELCEALAIATSLAAWNPAEVYFGAGGTVKPMMMGGWPPSVGIAAVRYAKAGITGPPRVLESKLGFFSTVARAYDLETLTDLTPWSMSAMAMRKRHANCGMMHAALDALVDLRSEVGADNLRAARVTHRLPVDVEPLLNKGASPTTANEARFDIRYNTAIILAGADLVLPKHCIEFATYLGDPDINEIRDRTQAIADPAHSNVILSEVEIELAGGQVIRKVTPPHRGSVANPLSTQDVIDKFQLLAGDFLSDAQVRSFISHALEVETLATVEPLVAGSPAASRSAMAQRATK
ncbi:MAG: hypothetical protein QOF31_3779 [Mycobacterium sp.]|jgi:2-methylcitrate dehydratase PrpD|nr:hypothetical protein [Mycobacterium sp.]